MGLFGSKRGPTKKELNEAYQANLVKDVQKIGKEILSNLKDKTQGCSYDYKEDPEGCKVIIKGLDFNVRLELMAKFNSVDEMPAIFFKISPIGQDSESKFIFLNRENKYTKSDLDKAKKTLLKELYNRLHL